jgi:DNA-binding IclR family transcriptional regulator
VALELPPFNLIEQFMVIVLMVHCMGNSQKTLKSIERNWDIIKAILELEGAGITELSEHLDFPKSTIHVHLKTLESKGLITKLGNTYDLSLRFVEYGEYSKNQREIYTAAREPLEELADETGQTATCIVEENGLSTVLRKEQTEEAPKTSFLPGTKWYLHCTAGGKAILSQYSDDKVESIIEQWGMKQPTSNTIGSKETLFNELERVRADGVAYNDEEAVEGVSGIGAPVVDSEGTLHGAVSISAPTHALEDKENLSKLLKGVANTIEVELLWQ